MTTRKSPGGPTKSPVGPARTTSGVGGGYLAKGNARYDRHDHYYKLAKSEGFAARSVYKLEEMDKEHKLILKGDVVVDLGCAPGSWLPRCGWARLGPAGSGAVQGS